MHLNYVASVAVLLCICVLAFVHKVHACKISDPNFVPKCYAWNEKAEAFSAEDTVVETMLYTNDSVTCQVQYSHIYIYIHTYLSNYLSIYLYLYIYIYVCNICIYINIC